MKAPLSAHKEERLRGDYCNMGGFATAFAMQDYTGQGVAIACKRAGYLGG
jgi:hypothetical protein